jgi:nickel-dependent lactate racemase
MRIEIRYGMERLTIRMPEMATIDEYFPAGADDKIDRRQFMEKVIRAGKELFPIAAADLFIVNDAYRPTPTASILQWLKEDNRLNETALFLVATGCHKPPSKIQLEQIFGPLYPALKRRIISHDARDSSQMSKVGYDLGGEPVYLNKRFLEAKKIVVIGSVEPHYFAGFTGGRKSIFPGLCDYQTTARNHNKGVSFQASPMTLAGNPVEEHFRRLMRFVEGKALFSIQVVQGNEGEIRAVYCGKLEETFREAAELARSIFGHKVSERYDLILAETLPPLDANLYQLQKSLENCQAGAVDGGTALLFSPCREGVGSDEFYRLAERWQEAEDAPADSVDSFGIHKLARVKKIGERIDVYLHSELPAGTSDKVFFRSAPDPQSIIDKIGKEKKYLRTGVVRDAGHTVLMA